MAIAERILQDDAWQPEAEHPYLHRLEDSRSDEVLIRAAQERDRDAASALVERYYLRVRSFVSYLTGGRSNVEDLTQEVFARALGALGRFNGTYRFEPWLLRIAKNLVIDEARRRVRQPEATDPSELPAIEPTPLSLDHVWDSVSQQLSSSTVNAALERLPLRQRTVLVLREIEEMAYADIAQVVGTNVRGVEATLRRARARFRVEVANLESDEADAAICRRTLRLVAGDGVHPAEASRHLSRCPECRGKATLRKADRLFTALPPFALAAPRWQAGMVAASTPARSHALLGLVRTGVGSVAALPVAQVSGAHHDGGRRGRHHDDAPGSGHDPRPARRGGAAGQPSRAASPAQTLAAEPAVASAAATVSAAAAPVPASSS